MDNKGQMMVLETIFFAAIVILSLVFFYQLSPSSIVSNTYTYDLKIVGADALYSVYDDVITVDHPSGYPSSKLVHYLITNAYADMVSDLNNMLPSNVMYNIYVSDGTETVFWCNCFGDDDELQSIDPVTVSHCAVAMDLVAFSASASVAGMYAEGETQSNLITDDPPPPPIVFNVILEIWYI